MKDMAECAEIYILERKRKYAQICGRLLSDVRRLLSLHLISSSSFIFTNPRIIITIIDSATDNFAALLLLLMPLLLMLLVLLLLLLLFCKVPGYGLSDRCSIRTGQGVYLSSPETFCPVQSVRGKGTVVLEFTQTHIVVITICILVA